MRPSAVSVLLTLSGLAAGVAARRMTHGPAFGKQGGAEGSAAATATPAANVTSAAVGAVKPPAKTVNRPGMEELLALRGWEQLEVFGSWGTVASAEECRELALEMENLFA